MGSIEICADWLENRAPLAPDGGVEERSRGEIWELWRCQAAFFVLETWFTLLKLEEMGPKSRLHGAGRWGSRTGEGTLRRGKLVVARRLVDVRRCKVGACLRSWRLTEREGEGGERVEGIYGNEKWVMGWDEGP